MPEAIPYLSEWLPGTSFSPLAPPVREGWSRFNPSLVRRANGTLVANVRSSNYRIEAGGGYRIDDASGAIRTENHLVELDAELRPGTPYAIRQPVDVVAELFPVHGYEDIRLFATAAGLGALATVRDRVADGLCRIVLLELADDGEVTSELLVAGPTPGRHEKNWVPIEVVGRVVRFVYSWSPVVVGSIDLGTGELELDVPVASPWPDARGGGGGALLGEERLFVVHGSVTMPDHTRRYVHRFVTLDVDGKPRRASPHLALLGRGIEFAVGLVLDGDHVLVGFGLEDEEAWLARFPLAELTARLSPVAA